VKRQKKWLRFQFGFHPIATLCRWLSSPSLRPLPSYFPRTLNRFLSPLRCLAFLSHRAFPGFLLAAYAPPPLTTPASRLGRSLTSGAKTTSLKPKRRRPSFPTRILPRTRTNGRKEVKHPTPADISTAVTELRSLRLRRRREWMTRWRDWSVLWWILSMAPS